MLLVSSLSYNRTMPDSALLRAYCVTNVRCRRVLSSLCISCEVLDLLLRGRSMSHVSDKLHVSAMLGSNEYSTGPVCPLNT